MKRPGKPRRLPPEWGWALVHDPSDGALVPLRIHLDDVEVLEALLSSRRPAPGRLPPDPGDLVLVEAEYVRDDNGRPLVRFDWGYAVRVAPAEVTIPPTAVHPLNKEQA